MTRWQYSDTETVLQERAEYTLKRVAKALSLTTAENCLIGQAQQVVREERCAEKLRE